MWCLLLCVASSSLCLTMLLHLQAHIGSDLFFSTHPFFFNFVESTIPIKNSMFFFFHKSFLILLVCVQACCQELCSTSSKYLLCLGCQRQIFYLCQHLLLQFSIILLSDFISSDKKSKKFEIQWHTRDAYNVWEFKQPI